MTQSRTSHTRPLDSALESIRLDRVSGTHRRKESPPFRSGRTLSVLAALVLLGSAGGCRKQAQEADALEVFSVARGPLDITVTESGSLQAAESQSIKSEVSRSCQVLEMVEEGTVITVEDVAAGKVLVKLESTKIEEDYRTHLNSYESAKASLTEAKESLDIQKSENDSSIRGALLNLTFAMTELRKLVGDDLADRYAGKLLENIDTSIETDDAFDPEKLIANTPAPTPQSEKKRPGGGFDPKKIEQMMRKRLGLGENDPLPEEAKQRLAEIRKRMAEGGGWGGGAGGGGRGGGRRGGGGGPGGPAPQMAAGAAAGGTAPGAEARKSDDPSTGDAAPEKKTDGEPSTEEKPAPEKEKVTQSDDSKALASAALDVEPPEDIPALLDDPKLGGETLQALRTYQSDIELRKEELSRAQNKLTWTTKLFEKGFVTKDERDTDAFGLRRSEINAEKEETELAIYRRYEFFTLFQKKWSNVLEAREDLERKKAMARSRLAQKAANFNSRVAAFRHATEKLQDCKEDIENCTIRAKRPGLVVLQQQSRWNRQQPLEVGSDVRPQQTIFEFPNIDEMVVHVDIHEAVIDTVQVGQVASITVDAIPGETFAGKVIKKAVLPSSQSSWLNPDLKMYKTEVGLEGEAGSVRPGMTATVEILAQHLEDVVHVPIQAVQTDQDGKHYCYHPDGSKTTVELGKRNQIFVVVLSGLQEGEQILMTPPELVANL